MNGSIRRLIRFSFDKTKEILFPFRFKRWFKVFLIVWLAGHSAGGFGNGFNFPQGPFRRTPAAQETQVADRDSKTVSQVQTSSETDAESVPAKSITRDQSISKPSDPLTEKTLPDLPIPKIPVPLLIVLVVILLAITLLFVWLSARFNFVFLDLMVNRDVSIRQSFRAHRALGNSYFLWSLGFVTVGILGLSIGIGASVLMAFIWWLWAFATLIFILMFMMIGMIAADFILPVMFQDRSTALKAFGEFAKCRPKVGSIFKYFLVKFGLGIAALIVLLAAGLAVAIPVVLGVVMFVLPTTFLWAHSLVWLRLSVLVLDILISAAFVLGGIIAFGMLTLPIPIFFRAFELTYLARLIPQYNLMQFPFSGNPPGGRGSPFFGGEESHPSP